MGSKACCFSLLTSDQSGNIMLQFDFLFFPAELNSQHVVANVALF